MEQVFCNWIENNWATEGGLIQPAIAARIMEISRARMAQMIKEGKIKAIKHENTTFVSYAQIMKISKEKTKKIKSGM